MATRLWPERLGGERGIGSGLLANVEATGDGTSRGSEIQPFALDGCRGHCFLASGLSRQFPLLVDPQYRQLSLHALGAAGLGHDLADLDGVLAYGVPSR